MVRIAQPETSMTVWDAGMYAAKVVGVEETQSTFPGSEGKARLKWRFLVRNEEAETSEVWYWTNATLSAHKLATLRPLVRALFPEANLDDPQFVLDTDEAVGKRCRVLLGIDEERGRNRVEKVLAAEARKVITQQAPAAARSSARNPTAEEQAEDEALVAPGAVPF